MSNDTSRIIGQICQFLSAVLTLVPQFFSSNSQKKD